MSFTEKLKFRPPPVNRKLELSSVTRIHCKAEGQSEPAVRWLKDGKSELPAHVEDVKGVLVFNKVERSDAGRYTCVASNSQGTINKTIAVEVVGELVQNKSIKTSQKYLYLSLTGNSLVMFDR